jgi:hypothetical protein
MSAWQQSKRLNGVYRLNARANSLRIIHDVAETKSNLNVS